MLGSHTSGRCFPIFFRVSLLFVGLVRAGGNLLPRAATGLGGLGDGSVADRAESHLLLGRHAGASDVVRDFVGSIGCLGPRGRWVQHVRWVNNPPAFHQPVGLPAGAMGVDDHAPLLLAVVGLRRRMLRKMDAPALFQHPWATFRPIWACLARRFVDDEGATGDETGLGLLRHRHLAATPVAHVVVALLALARCRHRDITTVLAFLHDLVQSSDPNL
mmetsp:Transcript_65917/g.137635  ORF Transcript_65917/g.137635 Transcript_65917/m.137635 type:complete len:217 (-) Transcript_65917:2226-2876(-)